jgi:hypothetical protein
VNSFGTAISGARGCSSYRGRALPAVDKGDLAEVVAWAEGSELNTFARDGCLPGVYDEKHGAPCALHDDCLALLEGAFLEQAGDLLGLPSVHPGEELDALKGSNGVSWGRAGRWYAAVRLPGGSGAALEEVERPVLERPFDVAPRTVDLLAS